MFYIVDLHLHSHYSRATSKELNLESLFQWARIKGIHVVGTGDFTHPLWFKEIKEKLEPDGTGLFRLKNPPKEEVNGFKCTNIDVRFCLTSEISSIYKQGDKVYKNHNCIYAPDFETVARINAKLAQIGNIEADGRPILGLPARNLLEIVLETSENAHLIPAHIWTPWFSLFGSKSGYDTLEACFGDLSHHIFALETGLSSDPEMNWRLSMLDKYTLVSNSDAHSPQKLGREATLFNTEQSYYALFDALKTRKGFLGTYEFFPEEGKYHMDGHRKCNVCFEPEESIRHKNICPKCGQPLTIGVLHRVSELSDRRQPQQPEGASDFHYIIPLPEILAEIKNTSASSKTVNRCFQQVISSFGNEFTLLREVPIEDIKKQAGCLLAEAIRRMRAQEVHPQGGYDGEYGTIKIFNEGEISQLTGQTDLFGAVDTTKTAKRKSRNTEITKEICFPDQTEQTDSHSLNEAQQAVCETEGAVLVTAGPGTGKTKTLIDWIAHCIQKRKALPEEILAVTFTHKAADEMKNRLTTVLEETSKGITVGTFHSIAFAVLQQRYENLHTVYDDESREIILGTLFPDKEEKALKSLSNKLKASFENNCPEKADELKEIAAAYQNFMLQNGGIDLADIIGAVVRLWHTEPEYLEIFQNRYQYIAVDELQDINPLQYEFLKLSAKGKNILAIGDPDQSIYGFRGSDVSLFFRFSEDFSAKEISLQQNYRSSGFIVKSASTIIRNNKLRKDIRLFTHKPGKGKIHLFSAADEYKEAAFITGEIEKLLGGFNNLIGNNIHHDSSYGFSDIAVLFRTRAIGKALLSACKQSGIPVRFGDASSFLETYPFHLITDIIKLYLYPEDIIALDGVLRKGFKMSNKEKQAFLLSHPEETRFVSLFGEEGENVFATQNTTEAVSFIFEKFIPEETLDETGLIWKETILHIAKEYGTDLEQFLYTLLLDTYTDVARLKTDAVTLLTFHASKGLEYPVVFIAGAEEGVTPLLRENIDMEEERRLFYVALTRAKDQLFITNARTRKTFNRTENQTLSRFVKEIPVSLTEPIEKKPPKPSCQQMSLF